MPTILLSFLVSYLIGSIPTAFLVVKRTSEIDIRKAGSGNVGGRNALEVTGKKWVGVVVVLIDLLKGVSAVLLTNVLFGDPGLTVISAMAGVVTGHCYPVWLKFHGGRGLATGAGTLFVVAWPWVFVWLALYFGSEKVTKNVHASSVIALVGLPLGIWAVPASLHRLVLPEYLSPEALFVGGTLIAAVCLSRHIKPLQDYYDGKES